MSVELENALKVIIEQVQPDRVILFGSRARDEQNNESDYDLLVLKKGVTHPRQLAKKIYMNFRNIGAPVDVIVSDLDNYEEKKSDPYLIYNEAANKGITVYEK